jgi:predicted TIM-barrel fold metal-dependent hydrolase
MCIIITSRRFTWRRTGTGLRGRGELRRHHFDLAGTANRPAVAAITSIVPVSQILMGSDNPFVPLAETAQDLTTLGLSPADLRAIRRDNALALLPGLAAR